MNQLRIVYAGGDPADQEAFKVSVKANELGDVRVLVPAEAIAEIAAHRVDVLVADVMQPSQDVLSLMRAATLTNVRQPVPVLVTGPQDATDRIEACLQRGAADYLITPFDPMHPSLIVRRLKTLGVNLRPSRDLEATQILPRAGDVGAARPPERPGNGRGTMTHSASCRANFSNCWRGNRCVTCASATMSSVR